MVWMQNLGVGLLLATLLSGIIFVLGTKTQTKRIVAFAGFGFFVGIILILANHATSVIIPVMDEIAVNAAQIRTDASTVSELRSTAERHRDEIAMMVGDVKKAGVETGFFKPLKR